MENNVHLRVCTLQPLPLVWAVGCTIGKGSARCRPIFCISCMSWNAYAVIERQSSQMLSMLRLQVTRHFIIFQTLPFVAIKEHLDLDII